MVGFEVMVFVIGLIDLVFFVGVRFIYVLILKVRKRFNYEFGFIGIVLNYC